MGFGDVKIIVENRQYNWALFTFKADLTSIVFSGEVIDRGVYTDQMRLKTGTYLLVLEDGEPWSKRKGYGTTVIRKDVIIVKDGIAINKPIMGYGTSSSRPIAKCSPIK